MPNFIIFIAGLILYIVLLYIVIRSMECFKGETEKNLQTFAKILNTQVKKKFFVKSVSGYYKEREISICSDRFSRYISLAIRMTPRQIKKKPKFFAWHYLRPTENTFICGGKILYKDCISTSLDKTKDEAYIMNIIDELQKATEIVEIGGAYYKE